MLHIRVYMYVVYKSFKKRLCIDNDKVRKKNSQK